MGLGQWRDFDGDKGDVRRKAVGSGNWDLLVADLEGSRCGRVVVEDEGVGQAVALDEVRDEGISGGEQTEG